MWCGVGRALRRWCVEVLSWFCVGGVACDEKNIKKVGFMLIFFLTRLLF